MPNLTSAEFAISVGAKFDSYRVVLYPETPSSWGSNVVSSLVPPGSSHRGTRNIPQEVKNLRYSGLTEWGPLYLQFRHTAEYYGWCEADCLFALSLALTGSPSSTERGRAGRDKTCHPSTNASPKS